MGLDVSEILGENGRIARRIKNYELRPQQLELAQAVADALRDGKHLVAEAGTGVGKSFAYLVPAILHATRDQQEEGGTSDDEDAVNRVIVSTIH